MEASSAMEKIGITFAGRQRSVQHCHRDQAIHSRAIAQIAIITVTPGHDCAIAAKDFLLVITGSRGHGGFAEKRRGGTCVDQHRCSPGIIVHAVARIEPPGHHRAIGTHHGTLRTARRYLSDGAVGQRAQYNRIRFALP